MAKAPKKRTWRFQPVWQQAGDEKVFGLCEVHLVDGVLEGWGSLHNGPIGIDSVDDLRGTLVRMLIEAYRYDAVEYKTLKAGMTLTPQMPDVEDLILAIRAMISETKTGRR